MFNGRRNSTGNGAELSHHPSGGRRIIPPRGDYRTLITYQKAKVIYDLTFRFCKRYLKIGDRTIDQMVQAARSVKQNIAEGSRCGATSKESEIKLTNVARASLDELLEDYEDFLRVRDFSIWAKDSREARFARKLGAKSGLTFEDLREIVDTRPANVVANLALCLIHQTNYLLDKQLVALDRSFLASGGLRERMTKARIEERSKQKRKQP